MMASLAAPAGDPVGVCDLDIVVAEWTAVGLDFDIVTVDLYKRGALEIFVLFPWAHCT
jgi:hypothetical protein